MKALSTKSILSRFVSLTLVFMVVLAMTFVAVPQRSVMVAKAHVSNGTGQHALSINSGTTISVYSDMGLANWIGYVYNKETVVVHSGKEGYIHFYKSGTGIMTGWISTTNSMKLRNWGNYYQAYDDVEYNMYMHQVKYGTSVYDWNGVYQGTIDTIAYTYAGIVADDSYRAGVDGYEGTDGAVHWAPSGRKYYITTNIQNGKVDWGNTQFYLVWR